MTPDQEFKNGDSFIAPCRVLYQEYWADKAFQGYEFAVWEIHDVIDVKIIEVISGNWDIGLLVAH